MARPDLQSAAGLGLHHASVRDFLRFGLHDLGPALHRDAAARLLQEVLALRPFSPDMFLSEAAFNAGPSLRGVCAPGGSSLTEHMPSLGGVVEHNPLICGALAALLGPDWRVVGRRVVCGVPPSWMPPWLMRRIAGAAASALAPFVRPDWRDVAYFHDIDFHQGLIERPQHGADFIILDVNLHDVGPDRGPTQALPGSHSLGADPFPHHLVRSEAGDWIFSDRRGQRVRAAMQTLTGAAGGAAMWHPCTLQGTRPVKGAQARIGLRYVIARGAGAVTGLDLVNASLRGPLSLGRDARPAVTGGEPR